MSVVAFGRYEPDLRLKTIYTAAESGNGQHSVGNHLIHAFHRGTKKLAEPDWPETIRAWPGGAVAILCSDNDIKFDESADPLSHFLRLVQKGQFVGSQDSKEEEANSIHIAMGKINLTQEAYELLTPDEKAEARRAIGAESEDDLLWISEDRELSMDVNYRLSSVWDDVRDQELVREAFEPGHLFPGKRVKELVDACGGVVNFLDRLQRAREELAARVPPVIIDSTHTSYVTYTIKPQTDKKFPIPADGVYITISDKGRIFRDVLPSDRAHEQEGDVLELDHFDVYKQDVHVRDEHGRPLHTVETRRQDPEFSRHHSMAAHAMRAFVKMCNIPHNETSYITEPVDRPEAKILSNHNFGIFPRNYADGEKINGHERVAETTEINSLADIERLLDQAEGFVAEPIDASECPLGADPKQYMLEKRLVMNMLLADRLTRKPLGDANAYGRPIMVHREVNDVELMWWYASAKFKTVGARPEKVFSLYDSEDDLTAGLVWHMDKFKPNPDEPTEMRLLSIRDLEEITGVSQFDLGMIDFSVGSATSHIQSGLDDAAQMAYWKALAYITDSNGGGTEAEMKRFNEGGVRALNFGHGDFTTILVRVPIASRKEGPISPFLKDNGLTLDEGFSLDDPYYTFGNGRFCVVNTDHLAERKHVILGLGHTGSVFIGGAGTHDEIFPVMYHNLMVKMRGYGIFPGMPGNDKAKPLHIVNSKIENGDGIAGYYDTLKSLFTDEEWEMMDVTFHDTPESAFRAKLEFARDELFMDIQNVSAPGYGISAEAAYADEADLGGAGSGASGNLKRSPHPEFV